MSATHGSHWLEREDFGDVTVVRLKAAKLGDDDTTRDLFEQITALVDEVGRRKLVLSLGPVEYLQSLALGKLVMLNRKAQAAGGQLVLCNLSARAREVLDVTRLTSLFLVHDPEAEAVRSLA